MVDRLLPAEAEIEELAPLEPPEGEVDATPAWDTALAWMRESPAWNVARVVVAVAVFAFVAVSAAFLFGQRNAYRDLAVDHVVRADEATMRFADCRDRLGGTERSLQWAQHRLAGQGGNVAVSGDASVGDASSVRSGKPGDPVAGSQVTGVVRGSSGSAYSSPQR